MQNIAWFVFTVFVYAAVWMTFRPSKDFAQHLKRIALLVVLCIPLNINGNVFTVMGNATAEKDIYSVFSLYQKAGDNAYTIIGLAGYQQAGNGAVTVVGVASYQQAGNTVVTGVGIAGYQQARYTWTPIGLTGYQKAGLDAITFFGLSGYQQAGRTAGVAIGFAGYQRSNFEAQVIVGLALYQKVEEKTRAFGAGWPLKRN